MAPRVASSKLMACGGFPHDSGINMLVLGFESSCDETGVAMVQTRSQG
ncbi:MAG: hypothetical protein RLZZ573_1661, partial [Pseudomonadota bacterium]